MSEKQHISIIVEGMVYKEESWTANGRIQLASGKEITWTASHQKTLIVKLDESIYTEDVSDQVRQAVKSALGMINLPYSRSFEIKIK